MKKIITKNDLISKVIEKYPNTEEIFLAYGLHCAGCFASEFDTIETGCLSHGMDQEDREEMITVLNEII